MMSLCCFVNMKWTHSWKQLFNILSPSYMVSSCMNEHLCPTGWIIPLRKQSLYCIQLVSGCWLKELLHQCLHCLYFSFHFKLPLYIIYLFISLLCTCILIQLTGLYLAESGHLLISVGHGVLCEGSVGHVRGPGVPAVEERSTRSFVPLDTNPVALPSARQHNRTSRVTHKQNVFSLNPKWRFVSSIRIFLRCTMDTFLLKSV